MNIKKLLGKKIQEIRRHRKITQERLAELVELDTSSISNIENGKYYPSADNLDRILQVLNVKPSDVFEFEGQAKHEELLDEMYSAMKDNEKLTRLIYKFYSVVKFL